MKYLKYLIPIFMLLLLQGCNKDRRVFCLCESKQVRVLNNTAKTIDVAMTIDFINYEYVRSIEPFGSEMVNARTNVAWDQNCPSSIPVYLVGGDSTFSDFFHVDPCLKDHALILEVEN